MFTTLNSDFLLKLLINTISVTILVFGCYMKNFSFRSGRAGEISIGDKGNREHAISFLLFGVGVFTITNLLHSVDISMGFAFGLFAVFSMLRYRTESISVKEMTYLFLVIAMSLLSAVSSASTLELIILHAIFFLSAGIVEAVLSTPSLQVQEIQYERIDNIKPQNHHVFIQDLKFRTGLNVQDVEIVSIDFLRDTAFLRVFHQPLSNSELRSLRDTQLKIAE